MHGEIGANYKNRLIFSKRKSSAAVQYFNVTELVAVVYVVMGFD